MRFTYPVMQFSLNYKVFRCMKSPEYHIHRKFCGVLIFVFSWVIFKSQNFTLLIFSVSRKNKVIIMSLLKYLKPLHLDGGNSSVKDFIVSKEVCIDVSKIEKNKKRGEY